MNHLFKTFTSLLLGAAALASLVTGCVREQFSSTNPTYDQEANTVTTKFVLNINTNSGSTKMTAANVQANGANFRGMDEVHLLTYHLSDATNKPSDISSRGAFFFNPNYVPETASKDYNLGRLFTSADNITEDNSSRTLELALTLDTDVAVLYGKAMKTGDSDTQGALVIEGGNPILNESPTDLTKLRFSLVPRLSSQDEFNVGAFVFSRMLVSITAAGLIDEVNYWKNKENSAIATGNVNRSYGFWWPRGKMNGDVYQWDVVSEGCPQDNATKANSEPYADGDKYPSDDDPQFTYHRGSITWKDLGIMYDYDHDNDPNTKPNEVVSKGNGYLSLVNGADLALGEAYSRLIHMEKDTNLNYEELRGGSAPAIFRTISDLYAVVNRVAESSPTGPEEYIAKCLAVEIRRRIGMFFNDNEVALTSYKASSTIAEAMAALPDWAKEYTRKDFDNESATINMNLFTSAYLPTSNLNTDGFPLNLGLPLGAAIISSESTMTKAKRDELDFWNYVEKIPAYGMNTNIAAKFPIQNYCYPPELLYFGNSPLWVSDEVKSSTQFPHSITEWKTGGTGNYTDSSNKWKDWTRFGKVLSSTRSVAMTYNINYGTALLKYSIAYGGTGWDNYLYDNNGTIHSTENDHAIKVSGTDATNGLKLTGIVIGGQPKTIGWDFTHYPDGGDYTHMGYSSETKMYTGLTFNNNPFDKMVYDKIPDGYKVGTTATSSFYTLLFDNYNSLLAEEAQSDVYIALEFVNNTGQDFWGELNIIPQGGTFYLVGKMDRNAAVTAARTGEGNETKFKDLSRDNYRYPPFNPTTGATINAPRVFMQDYMTTANITLGKDALKHAYVTVPDLRSSQVSFGLSIDINWAEGLTFPVEIGVPTN